MFVTPLSSSQVTPHTRVRPPAGARPEPGVDAGRAGRRRPPIGVAWVYLAVGLVLVGIAVVLPDHAAGLVVRATIYGLISWSATVAVFVGIGRNRPVARWPWLVLGAGQLVCAAGDTVFDVWPAAAGPGTFPGPANWFYLGHYPFAVVGLALLTRRRIPGRDRSGLLDAATVAVAGTMLAWLYVIAPSIAAGPPDAHRLSVEIVSVAYPVLDLAVLAIALRLVLGAGDRSPSFLFLLASLVAMITADTGYVLEEIAGTYRTGSYVDSVGLAGNLLIGAAALHPTMGRPGRRHPPPDQHLATVRLVGILVAGLVAPTVLFCWRSSTNLADIRLVAATWATIFVLITIRMHGLASSQRRLAITDGLTGLHTRRFLETQLPHEVARALRAGRGFGLFIVDVDHFKSINDQYGHPAGDRALAEIAGRLRSATRSEDVLARYGGEEFALLAPHLGIDDLARVAERLREEVANRPIAVTDDVWVAVTVSVGAAGYPLHARDESGLISVADAALYAAKAAGRDRVVIGSRGPAADHDPRGGGGPAAWPEADRPGPEGPLVAYLHHVADEVDARLSDQEHGAAVGRWAGAVARELGLDPTVVGRAEQAGRLHDIGKITIPRGVLTKPTALSDRERVLLAAHPEHGARLARLAPGMEVVAEIISQHHERFDGGGYPDGRAGAQIRIEARIVAVCDSWAAMRADRAYESAVNEDDAVRRLLADRATAFDPRVLDAFISLYARGRISDLRPRPGPTAGRPVGAAPPGPSPDDHH